MKTVKKICRKDLHSPKVCPTFAPHLKRMLVIKRKFGWVAETTSLLNWRTGNRTGGSNPPASAKKASVCKSRCFSNRWIRLTVRTHASHACNTSSILVSTTKFFVKCLNALLAQLVEQLTLNQWVQGSNPWGCTNFKHEKKSSENYWFSELFLF